MHHSNQEALDRPPGPKPAHRRGHLQGRKLTGKLSVSKTDISRSNRDAPANSSSFISEGSSNWYGTGPENRRALSHESSSLSPSAKYFWRRRLKVGQQFAKSPRVVRVQVQLLSPPLSFGTRSSAESERNPAEVEVARSNRAGSIKIFTE